MRFVDMTQLEPSPDWQARAERALNALRNEIMEAEVAARAAGDDIASARKAAISAGLKVDSRQQIWRDLAPDLARLRKQKCWYSESRNPTADKNVDHFRPKNRVDGELTHEGYWWLAFDWTNYRYSSQWCNQRRVEGEDGTSGGKADQFPLCAGSFRAWQEGDDIELERPELLDPADPEDWKLLTFRPDGYPTPAKHEASHPEEYQRATRSIEIYHLHCKELVAERRALAGSIERLIQTLERLLPKIADDPKIRATYKNLQINLLQMIDVDSEYSSAALAYARAEVYKLERGHLVKREWLESILS
jgi:uncharacterized protein (TIGR02646 family)